MASPVRSQTMNLTLISKNILTLEELELYELAQLSGITMEPATFKILLDLLRLNVSPQAVLQMLKTMCVGRRKKVAAEEKPSGDMLPPPKPRGRTKQPSMSGVQRPEARR